jgi:hypothetical protein
MVVIMVALSTVTVPMMVVMLHARCCYRKQTGEVILDLILTDLSDETHNKYLLMTIVYK